jgi:hypothetical protein
MSADEVTLCVIGIPPATMVTVPVPESCNPETEPVNTLALVYVSVTGFVNVPAATLNPVRFAEKDVAVDGMP